MHINYIYVELNIIYYILYLGVIYAYVYYISHDYFYTAMSTSCAYILYAFIYDEFLNIFVSMYLYLFMYLSIYN